MTFKIINTNYTNIDNEAYTVDNEDMDICFEVYQDGGNIQSEEDVQELCDWLNNLLNEHKTYYTKMVKAEKELQDIKTLIKTSMESERTHIGYNTLKQLMENIK